MVTYCEETKKAIEEDTTGWYNSTIKELEEHEKYFKIKIHLEISPDRRFQIYVNKLYFSNATGIVFVPEMFNLARNTGLFHPVDYTKMILKREKQRAKNKDPKKPRTTREKR